jgi:predicted amidohydrolase
MSSNASDNHLLTVALIQPDLQWLKPTENLCHLSSMMMQMPDDTDLVVLPEMFTSGFTQKPESVANGQQAITWMKEQAKLHDVALTGSVACHVDRNDKGVMGNGVESVKSDIAPYFVNRMLFITPAGDVTHYDKSHLFQMGGEHKRYKAGDKRCVVTYKGWRLLLTVCYDLRFPVFCRNQQGSDDRQEYDAMLCVANWPAVRRHPWRTLLQARAIENQAYVVGVNRVGEDGNGLLYNGDSMAVNFQGEIAVDGKEGNESVLMTTLSMPLLQEARQCFPVWQDADKFILV